MATEVVMPRMGLTMEEGTVVRWLKREGEAVRAGEILLEIETDKVTTEIEARAEGVLGKILVAEGETVPIGTPIAIILAPGEALAESVADATERAGASQIAAEVQGQTFLAGQPTSPPAKVRASPAARRAARQLGVDLSQVHGHGPLGRVLESDVRRHVQEQRSFQKRLTPVAARMAAELGVDLTAVQGSGPRGAIRKADLLSVAATAAPQTEGEWEEVRGARKVMAERMAFSFSTAPHFYLMAEADATNLVALRERLLPRIEARTGSRLTYTDLLVCFVARALSEHPMLNAAWEEGRIRRNTAINIGIAVDTEQALMVPVIHAADKLSLSEVVKRRAALVEKARAGQLSLDEISGGTFTLSNLGTFRVDQFNAVLNPPQAAILAVGRIHEAVLPFQGQAAVRWVIGLSLTCDHRVLDGAKAARFLERVMEIIEEPYTLLA
jgi:pyruvate dehydrogenase E2 component (dihydrolipoamide acetyltransferase)